MATDIASLEMAVGTSGVVRATSNVDALTNSAARAERAAGNLTGATEQLSSATNTAAQRAEAAARATGSRATASDAAARSAQADASATNAQAEAARSAAAANQGLTEAVTAEQAAELRRREEASRSTVVMQTMTSIFKQLAAAYAAYKVADQIRDAAMLAARYETLGVVMRVAGNNAGYNSEQLAAYEKQLQKTGISMKQSRDALIQLSTANIDLSKAQALARTAQDLAVVGNINSSEALASLIHGIKSGQVEVLQTLGLNVSFEASYKSMAQQLHKNVDALTAHEKTVARTNIVLQEGKKYAGIYEEALGTAGKQISSLARYLEDLKTKIGAVFLPALAEAVREYTTALKAANAEADKMGSEGKIATFATGLLAIFNGLAKAITIAFTYAANLFNTLGSAIGAVAAQAAALVKGDFATAVNISKEWQKDALAGANSANALASSLLGLDRTGVKLVDTSKKSEAQLKSEAKAREDAAIAAGEADRKKQAAAEKAAAAAEKAEKEQKKYDETYKGLVKSIEERTAASTLDQETQGKLTAGQSLAIKVMEDLRTGELKLSDAKKQKLAALLEEMLRQERLTDSQNADKKAQDESEKASRKASDAIWDEVRAVQEQIDTYNLTAEAVLRLAKAKVVAKLGATELSEDETRSLESQLAALDALIDKRDKLTKLQDSTDTAKAKELLDILTAVDAAAKEAASSMGQSFGRVGTAIGALTTALSGYERAQAAVAAQLATGILNAKGDPEKEAKAQASAEQQRAQLQVKNYGDMASAAKGFFKENTAGYKVMEGVEKAYRAVELATAVKNTLEKTGLLTAFTSLFVTSKVAETTAEVATVPATVAAEGAKQTALATTAMAGAIAVPFPGNLAAVGIVAAMLAAIGLAIGGGGGSSQSVSQQRQAANGTGTVFGDSSAKSESITNALKLTADNSSIELNYTLGMLQSLRAIESSLSGLGNLLIRNGTVTGSNATGSSSAVSNLVNNQTFQLVFGGVIGVVLNKLDQALGGIGGKIATAIFGGKTTVNDTGLTAQSASLASILANGISASSYADITKSGGLFHSDKNSTQLTSLGSETNDQFTKVIISLAGSVGEAAKLLGVGGDAFTQKLNSFVVDIGKISLKGLTGEQIQTALENAFSKLGDDMAQFAVGGLQQFQKVGEGYLETLTRIATDYANLDSILASVGATFGQTGLESIAARERLIELAGGISDLASNTSSFANNFLSKAEQLAPVQKYVTEQLAALGLQGIDTRDKFKEAVLGLANSGALATESGAKTYAALLALSDAFAQTHAATEDLTRSEQDIADERKDLQTRLDDATMNQVQLATKARDAIDAHNRALYDQVVTAEAAKQAQQDLATAQQNAAQTALSALQTAITSQKAVLTSAYNDQVASINAWAKVQTDALQVQLTAAQKNASDIKSIYDSLSSSLDSVQELTAVQGKGILRQAQAYAAGGGSLTNFAGLSEALSAVGKTDTGTFATALDFARGQAETAAIISDLKDKAGAQLSVADMTVDAIQASIKAIDDAKTAQLAAADVANKIAQAELDATYSAAKAQLDALNGINTSVLTVAQAMSAFASSISAIKAAGGSTAGPSLINSSSSGIETTVNGLYNSLLGRNAEAAGLAAWVNAYNSGAKTLDQVVAGITGSDEYKKLHGFAQGGVTDNGPFIAGEHGAEVVNVGQSRVWSASQTREMLKPGDPDTAAAVQALAASVANQQAALDKMASNTVIVKDVLNRVTQGNTYLRIKAVAE